MAISTNLGGAEASCEGLPEEGMAEMAEGEETGDLQSSN